MKVLVIGSGGREHALAWRIAKSKRVSKVFVAPGNAGTALDPNLTNVPANNVAEWLALAKQEKVDLTIVGPEAPLAAGVV
ncbi:phosphoribosylamine--glycine ligase family protein, partial (plasmid) [Chromobacterium amazonense]